MRSFLFVVLILLVAACTPEADSAPAHETSTVADVSLQRGEHLVTVLDCNACHTPFVLGPEGPEPDMTRMLSGHPEELVMPEPPALGDGPWVWVGAGTNTAFAGPWGVSYAPNLTPDPSGLGAWDRETFVNAIRSGKHWGVSRPILPPMPWPAYRHLSDEDLAAIFDYLMTVPPIRNHAPDSVATAPSAAPAAAPAG